MAPLTRCECILTASNRFHRIFAMQWFRKVIPTSDLHFLSFFLSNLNTFCANVGLRSGMDGRIQSTVSTGWLFPIRNGTEGELNSITGFPKYQPTRSNSHPWFFKIPFPDGPRLLVVLLLQVYRVLRYVLLRDAKAVRSGLDAARHPPRYHAGFRLVGS